MEVYIPSFRYEESDLERGYTVFKIEVLMNGRKHFVEKRYSEFHALHKKLKKCIKTPEIPSKHVRNWVPKVLEQRRQGLETYLQAVILENEELPKLFLDFLNVRHLPSLPKAESCGSFDETESEESSKLSHQPVLLFLRDPYVLPAASARRTIAADLEVVGHSNFRTHQDTEDDGNREHPVVNLEQENQSKAGDDIFIFGLKKTQFKGNKIETYLSCC
ncbi:sorting nexin-24 isoform X1 [Symphalangus syndactylus]|uniref:sorting nexin-24 isoform X1 n=1 Tax=Symphalangus syndactylus TaxID=9590 RepID=UPI002443472D|nr:sorting nexin-24 isoform X1 [Symphalangus syndactylus]